MIIYLCIRIFHYQYASWNVSNHTNAFDLYERSCTITYKQRRMRLVPKNKWWQFKKESKMKNNMTILSKERKRPQRHSSYVTLLSNIIDAEPSSYEEVAKKKGKESTSSRRMMSRMQYLQVPTCSKWQHRGIQGKIHSTRLLTERRHRLWRYICNH